MKHIEGIGTEGNDYYRRFEFVMVLIWSEAFGALLAYGYLVNLIWANAHLWEFWDKENNYHFHLFKTANEWQASIAAYPAVAAFVEGIFSLAQYILPIFVTKVGLEGNPALLLINSGKAIFAGIGAPFTGGYFNPIVAFALEYKTRGHTLLTKTMVYWIAPILGTIAGIACRKKIF
ncbi:Aquaporin-12A [Orchesella cincta]|uniref:Aquaporin-12A n=1 Tax=Orchesella cincta TaxID=48709 RepID=A0A1D2MVF2_ORCCI|nr:Aquaporin-12A [Orchesella cincta]